MFKFFKIEAKNQFEHKIKVVMLDRGGEYYGWHTDIGCYGQNFYLAIFLS